jgi:hypothetical protein
VVLLVSCAVSIDQRDLGFIRRFDNGTAVEKNNVKQRRKMVKCGMLVEVVVASPAEAETFLTLVKENESRWRR